jgi:PAS domain S-box-containing protein
MNFKIVYIEDDATDFLALKRILKPISHFIDLVWINTADSLKEFKESAELTDLILLDYHFPGYDSQSIINYFRSKSVDIEIAMLTAFEESSFKESIKMLGVNQIFSKSNLEEVYHFIYENKLLNNVNSEIITPSQLKFEKDFNKENRIFSGVFQTLPDPFILLDSQFNIIFKNHVYEKLAESEFLHKTENFTELIQSNRSENINIIKSTNIGQSHDLFIQIENKKNQYLFCEIKCSFIPKDNGYYCLHFNSYKVSGIVNDNLKSIDYFQNLIPKYFYFELAISANAQILINQNFEILGVNNKITNLFKKTINIGSSFLALNTSINADLISNKIRNSLVDFISFPINVNNFIYEVYINVIFSYSFDKIYAISFLEIDSDIKLDTLIVDPIKNNQLLIDNSKSFIFQLNKNGEVIYLSESYESITGFSIQEILNKPLGENQDIETQERVKKVFLKLANGEISEATGYSETKTKGNATKHLRYRVESILDVKGNFLGISGVFTDVSDTFQISKNLKKTEASFKQILNNINELIYVIDKNARINFVTPSSFDIIGYKPEELIGQKFLIFVHPEDYNDLIKFLKIHPKENKIAAKLEYITVRFKKKNGDYTYLETFINKVDNESSKKIQYIGTSRSVDEKIATDLKLKEAKKYLEIVTQIQKIYIETRDISKTFEILLNSILLDTKSDFGFICEVLFDEEGNPFMRSNALTNIAWDSASKEFYEKHAIQGVEFRNLNTLFGRVLVEKTIYISNDAVNDPYSGGIPPGHPIIKTFIGIPIFKNKEMVAVLGLANNLDGYSIELVAKIEPLLGNIGSIIEQNKIELEIIKTQRELVKSETQIKSILTSIEDTVFEINEELVITNVWAKDPEKLAIPKIEYFNQKFESLIDKYPYLSDTYKTLLEVTKDGVERSFEYSLNINNTQIWNKVRIFVLTVEPFKIYCLQISDITISKSAEENLKQNLIQAKELAKLKSRFVTLTSHEFRTPLTSISSSNELIFMNLKKLNIPINEKLIKYNKIIQNEVTHMTTLLNDVLILGKIDANKMPINLVTIDLKEVVIEILDYLFSSNKINIKIETRIKGKPFKISTDIKILEHILENITNNSIKYSIGKPAPFIEINYQTNCVVLALQDFGIGIPKLEQPNLFEQFFRASNVGKIHGVGLGLLIVKKMVESLDGDIKIESEEGVGTRIEITLNKSNLE